MTTADVALLITAIGGSVAAIVGSAAAIITAISALKNSNNNSARMAELEKENEKSRAEAELAHKEASLKIEKDNERMAELERENEKAKAEAALARAEADRLKVADELKTQHNKDQDAVILQQQIEIQKYQKAFDQVGRQMNQMQLSIGAMQQAAETHHPHNTAPLHLPTDND